MTNEEFESKVRELESQMEKIIIGMMGVTDENGVQILFTGEDLIKVFLDSIDEISVSRNSKNYFIRSPFLGDRDDSFL